MRKAALLDILFPLKYSCMEHHSSKLDTGKTGRCFGSFVRRVEQSSKGGQFTQPTKVWTKQDEWSYDLRLSVLGNLSEKIC